MTSTPLSPFPAMVGPDSVKILRSSLKFPSVNQTRSKHPTSSELLKIWNYICKVQHPSTFCTLSSFKRNIRNLYKNLLGTVFDIEMPCTWYFVFDVKFVS